MSNARKESAELKTQPNKKTSSNRAEKKLAAGKSAETSESGNGTAEQAARQAIQAKMLAAGFGEIVIPLQEGG